MEGDEPAFPKQSRYIHVMLHLVTFLHPGKVWQLKKMLDMDAPTPRLVFTEWSRGTPMFFSSLESAQDLHIPATRRSPQVTATSTYFVSRANWSKGPKAESKKNILQVGP